MTVAIGLIFLGSAAIGRPLMYVLARASMMRTNPAAAQELEDLKDNIYFRRTMTIMTLVWGFGLVGEAAVAGALVFALTVSQFLIVSPIIGYQHDERLFLLDLLVRGGAPDGAATNAGRPKPRSGATEPRRKRRRCEEP